MVAPAPPRAGLPKLPEVGNVWGVQDVSFVCPCNAPSRARPGLSLPGQWTLGGLSFPTGASWFYLWWTQGLSPAVEPAQGGGATA